MPLGDILVIKDYHKKAAQQVKDKKKEARIFLEEEYQLKNKYRKKRGLNNIKVPV